jgi:hypothetical protein
MQRFAGFEICTFWDREPFSFRVIFVNSRGASGPRMAIGSIGFSVTDHSTISKSKVKAIRTDSDRRNVFFPQCGACSHSSAYSRASGSERRSAGIGQWGGRSPPVRPPPGHKAGRAYCTESRCSGSVLPLEGTRIGQERVDVNRSGQDSLDLAGRTLHQPPGSRRLDRVKAWATSHCA